MKNLLEREKELFLHTYKRIPLDIDYGKGVHLISRDGTRYLDFFSGLGVNALGHAHPGIVAAVRKQVERFAHVSNYYITDVQIEFTEMLLEISQMSKVFLTNSGTEAVEAAIKAVRKIKGSEGYILSLSNAFHGRTSGALSLTARKNYKNGFEPLLPNIQTIEFNNVDDLQVKLNSSTAAVFIEFLQGEGGINLISKKFAELLNELCKKYGIPMIADCIQSGIGRTGKPFAYNYLNAQPDIVLVAKSIGGGLPLGAMLTKGEYESVFSYGSHGSTFGGNPVSCAAGKVVLEEIFYNGLMNSVAKLGNYLMTELNGIAKLFPSKINEIRGLGFMIGIEMADTCTGLVEKLFEKKVIVNCTDRNVLRILPPLISTKSDIDFFLSKFHEVLKRL